MLSKQSGLRTPVSGQRKPKVDSTRASSATKIVTSAMRRTQSYGKSLEGKVRQVPSLEKAYEQVTVKTLDDISRVKKPSRLC